MKARSLSEQDLLYWNQIEGTHCAIGAVPESKRLSVYRARLVEFNAKKAEALSLIEETDALQAVRTLLMRGNFASAETCLQKLALEAQDSPAGRAETLLELARLAAFRGRWQQSIDHCSQGLAQDCAGMTRMTLLQVRAIAQVELGYFRPAEKDLQTIESLVELYPHGNPGFYAEATLIRLLGKSGRSGMAQTRLSHLWRRFSNEVPTVDHLLTLFRAELHLQGYRAKNALELAIGSYLLATAMGDRLYSGLAWLDVTRCFAALDDRSSRILEDWAHAYERVADARDSEPEARGTLPASHFAGVHAKIARAESLFIPEPGLSICLKKNMVAHRSLQPQVAAGFCALADAQLQMLSKEVLFKHIWTGQRFSSQLHDPILRTLLKRMRSQSGADLKTVRGHIESGSVWVVRHFN